MAVASMSTRWTDRRMDGRLPREGPSVTVANGSLLSLPLSLPPYVPSPLPSTFFTPLPSTFFTPLPSPPSLGLGILSLR